ncbi:MAG: hypothetical protein PQJ60_12405 [Spirochaetales bacterium]|nr:hypothetical protein [Spirochaetales bacterium]
MPQQKITIYHIFKETSALYKKTFLFNFLCFIVIFLPYMLTGGNQMQILFNNASYNPANYLTSRFWTWYGFYMLYCLLAGVIINYMVTCKACQTYLGVEEKWESILKKSLPHFVPMLLLILLFSLGIAGGTLLLIAPGIIFALAWSLYAPVFVMEDLRGKAALKRSRELAKGYKSEIFGVGFIFYLIIYLVMLAFVILIGVIVAILYTTQDNWVFTGAFFETRAFWSGYIFLIALLSSAISPFYMLIPVTFYFNLKRVKEAPQETLPAEEKTEPANREIPSPPPVEKV